MSPELGLGGKYDSTTDIFSLGVAIYQIITKYIVNSTSTKIWQKWKNTWPRNEKSNVSKIDEVLIGKKTMSFSSVPISPSILWKRCWPESCLVVIAPMATVWAQTIKLFKHGLPKGKNYNYLPGCRNISSYHHGINMSSFAIIKDYIVGIIIPPS